MSFRNSNSYNGEYCIFSNTNFKRILKEYCEKSGYTQTKVKEEIEEKFGIPTNTLSNWLKYTKPIDGEISKDGNLNKNSIIVKLSEYFGVDVIELLDFPNIKKKEIKMELANSKNSEKYNIVQIEALKHLNDVVMDYMILECHVMEEYSNEYSTFQYYDYSKLVNEKFNIFKENKNLFLKYIENLDLNNDENKKRIKEYRFKTNMQKNEMQLYTSALDIDMSKFQKVDFEKILKEQKKDTEYYLNEARTKARMMQYGTDDESLANILADESDDNSSYAYVLYEIYKVSHLLREEFIKKLICGVEWLFLIYSACVVTDKKIADQCIQDDKGNKLPKKEIEKFKVTDFIKDLFSDEINKFC